MVSINPVGPFHPNHPIIPRNTEPAKQVPLDPTVISSMISPFHDFDEFRRKKELKQLRELEEIWAFIQSKTKGPIMDVYFYLHDLMDTPSELVRNTAERILDYLNSTRMRGS